MLEGACILRRPKRRGLSAVAAGGVSGRRALPLLRPSWWSRRHRQQQQQQRSAGRLRGSAARRSAPACFLRRPAVALSALLAPCRGTFWHSSRQAAPSAARPRRRRGSRRSQGTASGCQRRRRRRRRRPWRPRRRGTQGQQQQPSCRRRARRPPQPRQRPRSSPSPRSCASPRSRSPRSRGSTMRPRAPAEAGGGQAGGTRRGTLLDLQAPVPHKTRTPCLRAAAPPFTDERQQKAQAQQAPRRPQHQKKRTGDRSRQLCSPSLSRAPLLLLGWRRETREHDAPDPPCCWGAPGLENRTLVPMPMHLLCAPPSSQHSQRMNGTPFACVQVGDAGCASQKCSAR